MLDRYVSKLGRMWLEAAVGTILFQEGGGREKKLVFMVSGCRIERDIYGI